MAICMLCGLSGLPEGPNDRPLCAHHDAIYDRGATEFTLAQVNRIACDFFHRRIEPPWVETDPLLLEKMLRGEDA